MLKDLIQCQPVFLDACGDSERIRIRSGVRLALLTGNARDLPEIAGELATGRGR